MKLTVREQKILHTLGIDLDLFLDKKAKIKAIEDAYLIYTQRSANPNSNAIPEISVANSSSVVEHEASVGRVSQNQLNYLVSRGLAENQAISLIITKKFSDILSSLPLEFAIEAKKLIELNLEV